LWSVTLQSVPWLRQRHQSGSRKYVNTYTLWISLPAYQFGYQAVFEETISAPTPTDARKRPQAQSKTEVDQFTFFKRCFGLDNITLRQGQTQLITCLQIR